MLPLNLLLDRSNHERFPKEARNGGTVPINAFWLMYKTYSWVRLANADGMVPVN